MIYTNAMHIRVISTGSGIALFIPVSFFVSFPKTTDRKVSNKHKLLVNSYSDLRLASISRRVIDTGWSQAQMNAPMFPGSEDSFASRTSFRMKALANGVAVEFGLRAESVLGG